MFRPGGLSSGLRDVFPKWHLTAIWRTRRTVEAKKKGSSVPYRRSTISPARVFENWKEITHRKESNNTHSPRFTYVRAYIQPLLPPHGVRPSGLDSTAKVISRFIGSDIYYRRVYFYCVPFSDFFHPYHDSLSFEYNLKGRFCQTSTLCPFGLRAPSVRPVTTTDATAAFGIQTYA